MALTPRERRCLLFLLAAMAVVRLLTLGAYPLLDPTESRYAEIARKMLETGDWLVPQVDYGVPFWGKPPLSTWLSALSMAAFGVNEFAARLPSLLLTAGCAAMVYRLAALRAGADHALWALAAFATTGLVFISAGAVMTDPALLFATTLSMTAFWIALNGPEPVRRTAGFMFFVGLAAGLLAKGPVAVVLTMLPVGAWTLWTRRWRDAWSRIPWLGGTLLTLALAVPWYWAAERASPGFLDYFLVGEHWKRFVEPGWKGDLYGQAHARPRGTIWVWWFAAALPWSPMVVAWLARALAARSELAAGQRRHLLRDPWCAYLLSWTLAPMLFFTVSGNVLPTYVLPGLPAFALLLTEFWQPRAADTRALRFAVKLMTAGGIGLILVFAGVLVSQRQRFEVDLSHRALVAKYETTRAGIGDRLVYVGQRPISAEFYAGGKAVKVADVNALAAYRATPNADFFAVREGDLRAWTEADRAGLVDLGKYGDYRLLREAAR
ncbi:MAG TPA: glycosyltransferase family 39 protein [Casimicrobiaceae bacterium]|nr:glycosyltransferase family 39 protein [Casimicrobiaceae bacterium]